MLSSAMRYALPLGHDAGNEIEGDDQCIRVKHRCDCHFMTAQQQVSRIKFSFEAEMEFLYLLRLLTHMSSTTMKCAMLVPGIIQRFQKMELQVVVGAHMHTLAMLHAKLLELSLKGHLATELPTFYLPSGKSARHFTHSHRLMAPQATISCEAGPAFVGGTLVLEMPWVALKKEL